MQSGGQIIASGKKIGLLTESITLIYFRPGDGRNIGGRKCSAVNFPASKTFAEVKFS
ncbi:hypothetical protein UYSO10_3660 [Kosakonia radicincitans]|nr:hypothetical protein UYSO10_3660 [Kosakonia radicincitans]